MQVPRMRIRPRVRQLLECCLPLWLPLAAAVLTPLLSDQVKETESSAVKILQAIKLANWKIGKSKLFLKYYHFDELEALVAKYYADVVRTQCAVRTHFARKRYNVLLERARMGAAERAEAERL